MREIWYTYNRGDNMLALVTGGTSGIGLDIAKELDTKLFVRVFLKVMLIICIFSLGPNSR